MIYNQDAPAPSNDERRKSIGRRFRAARVKNGYTLDHVARRCGISRNAVSRWESGASFPIPEHLATVAELYRVSLDWLVREQDEAVMSDEAALLAAYRALPPEKQRILREIASEYFAD